jgi:DNA invertase Pin-like site-specific DNA recombinase
MRIGYARVSTDDQNLDLQRDPKISARREELRRQGIGQELDPPQLAECLRSLRQGDTLIVWRLDRLGRSVKDLVWPWERRPNDRRIQPHHRMGV